VALSSFEVSSSSFWLIFIHELGHNFALAHPFELGPYGQGEFGGFMDYGDSKINGEYSWGPQLMESSFEQTVNNAALQACCVTQTLPIGIGWNMISSYILPDSPDMIDVLQSIEADVVIMKDVNGSVVVPSIPLNGIGDWEVSQGYQLKSNAITSLAMQCTKVVPETTPISLINGWI
jgi:hypothetical protein